MRRLKLLKLAMRVVGNYSHFTPLCPHVPHLSQEPLTCEFARVHLLPCYLCLASTRPPRHRFVWPVPGTDGRRLSRMDGPTSYISTRATLLVLPAQGRDHGIRQPSNLWVPRWACEGATVATPFVAEPLVDNPATGDDFVIRAIGTTGAKPGLTIRCAVNMRLPFTKRPSSRCKTAGWRAS